MEKQLYTVHEEKKVTTNQPNMVDNISKLSSYLSVPKPQLKNTCHSGILVTTGLCLLLLRQVYSDTLVVSHPGWRLWG